MMLQEADVDLIRELVDKLQDVWPLRVIDLGAGSGTTAGAVFAERGDAGVIVKTYDISQENIDWARQFITNIGMLDYWSGFVRDSVEASVGHGELDLLLIDSSHEYEHTVAELNHWLPLLSRRASYVWAHDYLGEYPGVTKAIDEFVAAGILKTYKVQGLGWSGTVR